MIQAAGVNESEPLTGLVVSRGPVRTKRVIDQALVLATGEIDAERVMESVIICDGDVRVRGGVSKSLIVARGNILLKGITHTSTMNPDGSRRVVRRGDPDITWAGASTLVAGGTVRAKIPGPPVLIPGSDPDSQARNKFARADFAAIRVEVREKQVNPLGYITFFELRQIGLEVKAADGGVRVVKVTAGTAAERAGLKAGDAILEVGGKKPSGAESLRRLLRDALAVGDATLKLKRGNETITAKLSLPE